MTFSYEPPFFRIYTTAIVYILPRWSFLRMHTTATAFPSYVYYRHRLSFVYLLPPSPLLRKYMFTDIISVMENGAEHQVASLCPWNILPPSPFHRLYTTATAFPSYIYYRHCLSFVQILPLSPFLRIYATTIAFPSYTFVLVRTPEASNPTPEIVQGYLAHKRQRPPSTLP